MDGVAHFGWRGKLYNGFDFEPSKDGFANVGVEHIAQHGIFGRGVLVDLPRLYQINHLPPGTVIGLRPVVRFLGAPRNITNAWGFKNSRSEGAVWKYVFFCFQLFLFQPFLLSLKQVTR